MACNGGAVAATLAPFKDKATCQALAPRSFQNTAQELPKAVPHQSLFGFDGH